MLKYKAFIITLFGSFRFMPRPNLPKQEEDFSHEDFADPHDGSQNENRIKYPAV